MLTIKCLIPESIYDIVKRYLFWCTITQALIGMLDDHDPCKNRKVLHSCLLLQFIFNVSLFFSTPRISIIIFFWLTLEGKEI